MRCPLHVFRGPISRAHIQKLNGECLKAKRVAERNIQPERVQFKCGANVNAEVEYVKEEGQTAGRTRILRVIEHGYTSDSYDAESKY